MRKPAMKYLVTVCADDWPWFNAWTETEAHARLLCNIAIECGAVNSATIHLVNERTGGLIRLIYQGDKV